MALIKCEECGREVSNKAAACPHCGCPVAGETSLPPAEPNLSAVTTPPIPDAWRQTPTPGPARPTVATDSADSPGNFKRAAWVVGGLLLLVMVLKACDTSGSRNVDTTVTETAPTSNASTADADQAAANAAANAAAAATQTGFAEDSRSRTPNSAASGSTASAASGSQWTYSSSEEGMSGKPVRIATVTSSNTIDLDFPYAGSQHATLQLRRHPRWGNDVIFQIEQGQILCHSYGDCPVQLRFDDGKVIRLRGNPPEDNSSEYAFIPAFNTFLKKMPKAKRVRVEMNIYQGGAPVWDFDISGFDPEKFK